jgi:hypothetical protein
LLVMDLGPPSFGGPRRAPSAPRPKRASGSDRKNAKGV